MWVFHQIYIFLIQFYLLQWLLLFIIYIIVGLKNGYLIMHNINSYNKNNSINKEYAVEKIHKINSLYDLNFTIVNKWPIKWKLQHIVVDIYIYNV